MEFEFAHKDLVELYETGRSRKIRLPEGIARLFVARVLRIEAAKNINDLRYPPSMHFKRLHEKENKFSVRLNDQYRLIFRIDFQDEKQTTGFVTILELSKHYE